MIDYSNEIFHAVATDLRSTYPGIKVVGEYVLSPALFPTVTIDEISNVPAHLDSAEQPKYAEVQYRVQVFCNGNGKRAKAREIYATVVARLCSLGLVGKDIPYFAVNVPNDTCLDCGYCDEFNDECPTCGSDHIQQLRRVTGYLTGNYTTAFNKGKQQEVQMRVKHN